VSSKKNTLKNIIFSIVTCGEGWISFDNSCYKFDPTPGVMAIPPVGQAYCQNTYEGHLMVPNSKDEAAFIGNYLTGLMVNFYKVLLFGAKTNYAIVIFYQFMCRKINLGSIVLLFENVITL
jgi:hypothetical protein